MSDTIIAIALSLGILGAAIGLLILGFKAGIDYTEQKLKRVTIHIHDLMNPRREQINRDFDEHIMEIERIINRYRK